MRAPTRLALGDWVEFDHDTHQVVGFTDTGVRLRTAGGHMQLVLVAALLADPTFHTAPTAGVGATSPDSTNPVDPTAAQSPTGSLRRPHLDRDAVILELPAAEQARVAAMQAHLNEVETGHPAGIGADTADLPRPQFDPHTTTLSGRMDTKAAELGMTTRRLWQLRAAWHRDGLIGLCDKRKTRPRDPLGHLDPRVIAAIRAQAAAERLDSSATIGNRFHRRTQNRLDHEHGPDTIALPGKDAFRRIVNQVLDRRPSDPAAQRIRAAHTPDRGFGTVSATRPGELVMLDTTGLDVLAYDTTADTTVAVELTVALDVATRSLLAWRFTPRGTASVDIGLLLADIMTPEPMRPHWPDALRFSMLRIPHQRLLTLDQRLASAAARPVVYPESLIFDHGKPYQTDVVTRACRRLGINIFDARKYTPTDKPVVAYCTSSG
jgi:transposase InsO family protein